MIAVLGLIVRRNVPRVVSFVMLSIMVQLCGNQLKAQAQCAILPRVAYYLEYANL